MVAAPPDSSLGETTTRGQDLFGFVLDFFQDLFGFVLDFFRWGEKVSLGQCQKPPGTWIWSFFLENESVSMNEGNKLGLLLSL